MTKPEKLQEMLKLLNDGISKQDFVKNFDIVIKLVKDLKNYNVTELNAIKSVLVSNFEKLKETTLSDIENLKTKVVKKLSEVKDGEKSEPGENGVSPDPRQVAELASKQALEAIKPLIPTIEDIEQDLPKLGAFIRDGLELLQGEERLKIEAILGLREELDELKKLRTQTLGGGGFSRLALNMAFIDDETPTNSGDDLSFTIAHTPSPTSSLKVYRNGQRIRITEDYTFSGKTITLLSALTAGEIILCDYRI